MQPNHLSVQGWAQHACRTVKGYKEIHARIHDVFNVASVMLDCRSF